MTLPLQIIFSLDEAVEYIKHETGEPCTDNGLLQLAKNNQIRISFHKKNWEYVRIDEGSHEMENVHCKVLSIELVAPKDRRFLLGHATPYMGMEEKIFPFIGSSYLKRINNDGDTSIPSHNLTAIDEDKQIKVSIIEGMRFPKEGDAKYNGFKMWLLNEYGKILKSRNNSVPVDVGSYLREGYYYKLKGSENKSYATVTISKKDFCIIRSELRTYIKRILENRNGPTYTQEAINRFKEEKEKKHTSQQPKPEVLKGRRFLDSLSLDKQLTNLTPLEQLSEAKRQYEVAIASGDVAIAQETLEKYLTLAREAYGSSDTYNEILATSTQLLDTLLAQLKSLPRPNKPATIKTSKTLNFLSNQKSKAEIKLELLKEQLAKEQAQEAKRVILLKADRQVLIDEFNSLSEEREKHLKSLEEIKAQEQLEQETIKPMQTPEPVEPKPNVNGKKNEWELTENEYMKLKAYVLIPLVMKSLSIDPMAYPPQHNKSGLKKELHLQGRLLFNKRFRMSLESFSKGHNSAWSMARKNNLIKESSSK